MLHVTIVLPGLGEFTMLAIGGCDVQLDTLTPEPASGVTRD